MSLIWHIAKKDIRRMAWPTAAWLAFILIAATWFADGAPLGSVTQRWEADAWAQTAGWLTLLMTIVQLLLGYIFAGVTVLEDPLSGTTGFWQTRPITNSRIFLAKTVAALLLYVIAPVLVLVPVWLSVGFEGRTVLVDFAASLLPYFVIALVAVLIASLSRNLRHFLFLSVAVFVVYFLCSAWYPTHAIATDYGIEVRRSRNAIVQYGVIPVAVAILAFQYLTRNVMRSWLLLVLALITCLAVRIAWPWNVRGTQSAGPLPQSFSLQIEEGWLELITPIIGDSVYLPYGQDGAVELGGKQADLRLVSIEPDDQMLQQIVLGEGGVGGKWRFEAYVGGGRLTGSKPGVRIHLDVALAEVQRSSALPIRAGASTAIASSQSRIESVAELYHSNTIIVVRERDAYVSAIAPWQRHAFGGASRPREDYVLLNSVVRQIRPARFADIDAIGFAGMLVGYRQLTVPRSENVKDWTRDAELVRARMTPRTIHSISVPFSAPQKP